MIVYGVIDLAQHPNDNMRKKGLEALASIFLPIRRDLDTDTDVKLEDLNAKLSNFFGRVLNAFGHRGSQMEEALNASTLVLKNAMNMLATDIFMVFPEVEFIALHFLLSKSPLSRFKLVFFFKHCRFPPFGRWRHGFLQMGQVHGVFSEDPSQVQGGFRLEK